MTIARWTPPVTPTRQEQFILKRLGRVRKLLGFLRLHRHELFDAAFQDELMAMYRTTPDSFNFRTSLSTLFVGCQLFQPRSTMSA